ncbi:hypothetical protein AAB109_27940 (plasmid) [Priestia megaterium]|uniref:hypothetical protein n=1 Tax=Priestia megaterium TaxID=1404 RepID=UPI002ACE07CC|nr:hypothetical protein [Priestia megaterium]
MANHKRDITKFLNVKLKEDHLLLLHKDEVVAKWFWCKDYIHSKEVYRFLMESVLM